MPQKPDPTAKNAIQQHRLARLRERTDLALVEGDQTYLHRPGEVLVERDDYGELRGPLDELGASEREVPRGLEERFMRFEVDRGVDDLGGRVRRLRRGAEREAPLRIAPNHVITGLPYVMGGPATFAEAAEDGFDFAPGEGKGVRVAVIDTGYTPKLHDWLDERTNAGPGTLEEQDVQPTNGWLDDEAGHGTFIAGVVLSRAPSATVEIEKVLDTEGYGSDIDVALAILEHRDADVINLSLGCYTFDDQPPPAIAWALTQVSPRTAVVAAAGNDNTHRPHWPAAHSRVLGVAALDDRGARAEFSNYGWWIDAAARGVGVVSTFLEFTETDQVRIAGRSPQTFKRWARWSGTSFAAPKLAGEIAAAITRDEQSSAREAAAKLLADRPSGPLGAEFSF